MDFCPTALGLALDIIVPACVAGAVAAMFVLSGAARAKLQADRRLATMELLIRVVDAAVAAVNQRLCALIGRSYDPRSAGRGLTHTEALKLSTTAQSYVKATLGNAGIMGVARVMGLVKENENKTRLAVDNLIALLIEAEVWRAKQNKPCKDEPCK